MDKTNRFRARIKNHVTLILANVALVILLISVIPGDDVKYLWSMSTGYVATLLLAVTLVIGPYHVYLKKTNPVSTDLRRDIGIWCGLFGVVHVIVGIQVHMGNPWLYFFKVIDGTDEWILRSDLFGFANYTGLLAGLILVVLLLLSNDVSLQWLRSKKWKNLQRLNYLLFVLTVLHSAMYQIIEKRIPLLVISFFIVTLIPLVGQTIGYAVIRKR